MPTKRETFSLSVASSLAATLITSLASLIANARVRWSLVLGICAAALITGLVTFSVLAWRRQAALQQDVDRLEQASWPGWMRDIGVAADTAGIRVFRVGEHVVFVGPMGERHLLAADPAGDRLGQVLERDRALEKLAQWGVPVRRNARGQPTLRDSR